MPFAPPRPDMATEVEAKFRAEGQPALDRLVAVDRLGDAVIGPAVAADELDRYLDTEGGAFATARWACRLRERGGRTIVSLKGPPEAATPDGWHRRPEVEGPASPSLDPGDWPPSPARDLVDRLRNGAPLHEHLALRQRRVERRVVIGGAEIGTLSLDTVTVERAGRAHGTLHAVELELAGAGADAGAVGAAASVAAALGADPDLVPDPTTKLEHALAILGER